MYVYLPYLLTLILNFACKPLQVEFLLKTVQHLSKAIGLRDYNFTLLPLVFVHPGIMTIFPSISTITHQRQLFILDGLTANLNQPYSEYKCPR